MQLTVITAKKIIHFCYAVWHVRPLDNRPDSPRGKSTWFSSRSSLWPITVVLLQMRLHLCGQPAKRNRSVRLIERVPLAKQWTYFREIRSGEIHEKRRSNLNYHLGHTILKDAWRNTFISVWLQFGRNELTFFKGNKFRKKVLKRNKTYTKTSTLFI